MHIDDSRPKRPERPGRILKSGPLAHLKDPDPITKEAPPAPPIPQTHPLFSGLPQAAARASR